MVKRFKASFEKGFMRAIKILRTNCGGKNNSYDFASFCAMHGIRRQLTVAYSLQQTGVSNQKNGIILNMVQNMLAKRSISMNFWAKQLIEVFMF